MSQPEQRPVDILMVDDQPAKLLSYEIILAPLGEHLIRANSGAEALELLLKKDIAVVLVDVCMPGLDGFELATMIRQHPRCQKTSIILVSGVLVGDVDRLRGYDSGAVDYVSVPIVPEILRAKVAVFAELFRKTDELNRLNRDLEQRVAERTAEIEKTAARLLQSEERLRLVLTASLITGWTWNIREDSVTCMVAPGEPDSIYRSLDDFLVNVHPDDRAIVHDAFHRAVDDDSDYNAEFRVTEHDDVRWMLGRGTVLHDTAGCPGSIAGLNIDITERKRSEQDRAVLLARAQEAWKEAESANRVKDEFLATLSHELRTPLSAITGWAQILQTGALDEPSRAKAIEAISRNASLQTKLIADILDVSRIITGNLRLDLVGLEFSSVVEGTLDTVRPAAEAKGIRLETRLTDGGSPISGDSARLQQVVWNVLSNAIKFAPENGVVEVELTTGPAHVYLVVQDDGPGIVPEFLPFIFDRFRQADSSSTRLHHGLGLGLAIVRHLLEMHGGRIQAANRADRPGARFTIALPKRVFASDAAQSPKDVPSALRSAGSWLDLAPSLKGIHVLLVDDDPDGRQVVATILSHCGARVTDAATAEEALSLLRVEKPDVLLADIEMPGQDGYSLLQKVRSLPADAGGHIPAAALTAYASADDRMKALGAGFQMHLPKPVAPAELAAVVASLAVTVIAKRA